MFGVSEDSIVVTLNGVRFDQIYGDNSGGGSVTTFDTDGDGTATQEDEFVSITNTTGAPLDVSGWQIWSDSTGSGSPDTPVDGLYHTFPPGTVLRPGQTLFIINEISGPVPKFAQEASQGGVESDAGGVSTNLLTEGNAGLSAESVALVDPASGDYIVFNLSSEPPQIQNLAGFPGTNNVGTVDGAAIQEDIGHGFSLQFDEESGTYQYAEVGVPCFVAGTLIRTPEGDVPVECLKIGDMVETKDSGYQPVRWTGVRALDGEELRRTAQHPIEFRAGSLGAGLPARDLRVSPQHRMLIKGDVLAPARGLTDLPGVRVMTGCRSVRYHHVLLGSHAVIYAEGAATESLFAGPTFLASSKISDRLKIMGIAGSDPRPARKLLSVSETRRVVSGTAKRPARKQMADAHQG